jgi:hypothetical protein
MFECLIWVLVYVLAAVILVYVLEAGFSALEIAVPPKVWVLVRLIAALIILLYALRCFGLMAGGPPMLRR